MNRLAFAFVLACTSFSLAADSAPIRVALYDDAGSAGAGIPKLTEQLTKAKGIELVKVKADQIRAGVLKDFAAVIFTGGSGSKQGGTIGTDGVAEVKKFIEQGGGYVGICAGNYLACQGYSWGLGIIDAKTVSPKWRRGRAVVKMEVTDKGREILGWPAGELEVRYANGPIVKPAGDAAVPDLEPLAYFRSEVAENDTPKGVMVNSPAIVAGQFGKGRVICSSPHPEQTPGLEGFAEAAVHWVTGK